MNVNDHDRAKRLDEYIDALNAGRPAPQAADDDDLADLFATARDLHRLRVAEPAPDDVPSRLAAALERELRANPTHGTRRNENTDMSQFRDPSSNGSLRPPVDTGNTYGIPQRPERARQWTQFAVAAFAFIIVGVILAQIIGGDSDEPNSTFGTDTGSTPTTEVDVSNDVVSTPAILTPTVTDSSASPTSPNATRSADPTATHDLLAVVPNEEDGSPTLGPTQEPTPTGETQRSIEPDYATLWLSSDYVTCEDDVVVSGSRFEPGTTIVLYGGPLLTDSFVPVSDDIPVAANGSFEALLDVSRIFAQCRGADIDEEGVKYSLGADTGSTSTKDDLEGSSARTVITFSSTVPDEVKNRMPLPTCGTEVQRNDTSMGPAVGPDREMRECFANAVQSGVSAEFVSYQQMPEGYMLTAIHRSIGDGNVDMLVDATQDPVESRGWLRFVCVWNEMSNLEPFTFHWESCDEPATIE